MIMMLESELRTMSLLLYYPVGDCVVKLPQEISVVILGFVIIYPAIFIIPEQSFRSVLQ
jgi:hypothetical protein